MKAVDAANCETDINTVVNDTMNAIDKVEIKRYDGLNYKIWSEIINWNYLNLDFGQSDDVMREDISKEWLDYYYGQYNGFHIFHFRVWGFGVSHKIIIDNFSFITHGTSEIYAVRDDCGMTLNELYEEGHITRADLETIHITYSNLIKH